MVGLRIRGEGVIDTSNNIQSQNVFSFWCWNQGLIHFLSAEIYPERPSADPYAFRETFVREKSKSRNIQPRSEGLLADFATSFQLFLPWEQTAFFFQSNKPGMWCDSNRWNVANVANLEGNGRAGSVPVKCQRTIFNADFGTDPGSLASFQSPFGHFGGFLCSFGGLVGSLRGFARCLIGTNQKPDLNDGDKRQNTSEKHEPKVIASNSLLGIFFGDERRYRRRGLAAFFRGVFRATFLICLLIMALP